MVNLNLYVETKKHIPLGPLMRPIATYPPKPSPFLVARARPSEPSRMDSF